MIGDHPDSRMLSLSDQLLPRYEVIFGGKHSTRPSEIIDAAEFIGLKSFKAKGKRLTTFEVDTINEIDPIEPEDEALLKYYGPEFAELLGRITENEDAADSEEVTDSEEIEEGEETNSEEPVEEAPDKESPPETEDQKETEDLKDTKANLTALVEDIPFEVEIALGDEAGEANGEKAKRKKKAPKEPREPKPDTQNPTPDIPPVDDSGQFTLGW